MFSWLRNPIRPYRIRAVGGGFTAEHRNSIGWQMLDAEGHAGRYIRGLPGRTDKYLCETAEEAGRRCNLHSTMTNGVTVWTGG